MAVLPLISPAGKEKGFRSKQALVESIDIEFMVHTLVLAWSYNNPEFMRFFR